MVELEATITRPRLTARSLHPTSATEAVMRDRRLATTSDRPKSVNVDHQKNSIQEAHWLFLRDEEPLVRRWILRLERSRGLSLCLFSQDTLRESANSLRK